MDASHEKIVPYDPAWVDAYNQEAEKLRPVFGDELVDIEHIGSTAVPGLASKPIIDLAVLIKSHENADTFIEPLLALDYRFDRDVHAKVVSPERHLFRKGNPTRFHLSVAYADRGGFWRRQLLFRDYLRAHPEDRQRYQDLKQKLIQVDTNIDAYVSGKSEFINEILQKAGFN
jgi:GrpB-like predicted nucleotidyltransferase (UPF0157 family)